MAKENDVVLIYLEDQPISFARIEEISPDFKKDWISRARSLPWAAREYVWSQ
jgi:hypothetical protein